MAFRFQKRIKILPGVWINLSKTGVSASAGGKGVTFNVGADGRRMVTFGIPGTGMSYRVPLGGGILLLVIAVAVLIGLVYLIKPDVVLAILKWWQPQWF